MHLFGDEPVREAIAAKRLAGVPGRARRRLIAHGDGWSFHDIVCSAGPQDRAFTEQHAHTSVSFVQAGSFVYRSGRGHALLAPGAMLLGTAGAAFECIHEHAEGDHCLSFHYESQLLEELQASRNSRAGFEQVSVPALHNLSPLFVKVARAAHGQGDLQTLALEVLAAAQSKAVADADAQPMTAIEERRISDALRWITEHFFEPITLAELASRTRMSRFQLLRLFRKATGTTPHQYILRLRLRAAALRLLSASVPVTEIAYAVGFEDLSNFTRSFSAEFGMTPSCYRVLRS